MVPKPFRSKPGLAVLGGSGMIAVAAFAGTTLISHAAPANTNGPPVTAPNAVTTGAAQTSDAPDPNTAPGQANTDPANGPNDQAGTQQGPNDQTGPDTAEPTGGADTDTVQQ